jgi:hypothetical protein
MTLCDARGDSGVSKPSGYPGGFALSSIFSEDSPVRPQIAATLTWGIRRSSPHIAYAISFDDVCDDGASRA